MNVYIYGIYRDIRQIAAIVVGEVGGWGTHKNVRGEVGGWGRVPFNEPYAPSLRPVVKYHLRRGVGLIKFLKMVLDPSPPPLSSRAFKE